MPLAKPAWPILQRGDLLSVGLQLAWAFYENTGGTVNDLGGNRYNAAFNGNWTGGPSGAAAHTDGSSTQVSLVRTTGQTYPNIQTGDFTVATRFLVTTLGSYTPLFDSFDSTLARLYSLFLNAGGGASTVFWSTGGNTDSISIGQTIAVNTWYDFVVTRKGALSSFYINGKLGGTTSAETGNSSSTTTTRTLSLGGNPSSGGTKEPITYDYFALWNRAITPGEVAQLYFDSFSIYRPKRRVPWFTQAGTGAQNLSPSLLTNTSTFFAPAISAGAVNLTPGLFTNTNTFFAPTVSTAGNLSPSLFTNTNTFFSPTVGRGAVALAPSLFTNNGIFYSPTVTVAGPQALIPSLFTNQSIFYLPVVRSHIILTNVWVELLDTHEFFNVVYPKKTVFGGPSGLPVPDDFAYTPLMQGFSTESQTAIAQSKIDVWGRFDSHGNLLDNPPIPRPIYDPQPTPPVGSKHMLPLGNEC
jgi:hypothetical protein